VAIQLEGSYLSQHALRRFDPEHALYPDIERGYNERLKMVYHEEDWIIHRYILRERGITLIGPDPKTLIDPVSSNDLRRAMLPILHGWVSQMFNDPNEIISWETFIDRVWVERQYNQPLTPDTDAMNQTLDFIRYTLRRSQQCAYLRRSKNMDVRAYNEKSGINRWNTATVDDPGQPGSDRGRPQG